MSTAVIVGGTGFLGRHVVAAFQSSGWSVRSLSRRTGFNALHPDPESFRNADVVVNLAGIKRPEGEQTRIGNISGFNPESPPPCRSRDVMWERCRRPQLPAGTYIKSISFGTKELLNQTFDFTRDVAMAALTVTVAKR